MTSKWMMLTAAYLHAVGVATYLGGAIIMEFVLGPAQKAIPPAQAQVMGQKAADRFLIFSWSALGLILASGVLRLYSVNNAAALWQLRNGYDFTVLTMECLWTVLVVNGTIMTFVLRPKLSGKLSGGVSAQQAQAGQQSKLKAAQWANRIARIDLGVALVIALLGASLGTIQGLL